MSDTGGRPGAAATIETETTGPAGTEALAAELAERLRPGDLVLVSGELGAGKTTFVRGAARALGARGPVSSPTFTIGQLYPGAVPVAHLDLYRVGALEAEEPDLLEPYLGDDVIAFAEWADAAAEAGELGPVAAHVRIEHAGGDRRRIAIEIGDGGERQ